MRTQLMAAVVMAFAGAMLAVGVATAGIRDAGSKANGNVNSFYVNRGGNVFYAPATPNLSAMPTERRSFSAEPMTQEKPSDMGAAVRSPIVAPEATRRSYSVEPTTTYRASNYRRSNRPSYALPKTDPRKFQ